MLRRTLLICLILLLLALSGTNKERQYGEEKAHVYID
jgi:hypothetical protein